MARIDNCDKVFGEGEAIVAIGAYKDANDKSRYKFGLRCPTFTKAELGEELWDKFAELGIHRAKSVDAAGNFNKANEFGTDEDAQAYVNRWSTVEGYTKAFEKAHREGGGAARVDTDESLAIRFLMKVLRKAQEGGTLASAKVPIPGADSPPKTEKGAINYNAWAKQVKAAEHPWYAVAYKKVTASDKGFD